MAVSIILCISPYLATAPVSSPAPVPTTLPCASLSTGNSPLDIQGRGMMQQAVQDRRGQHLVTEDLAPVDKALVGGQDEAGLLIAALNETNNKLASSRDKGR